jgi:hypothetical protein
MVILQLRKNHTLDLASRHTEDIEKEDRCQAKKGAKKGQKKRTSDDF